MRNVSVYDYITPVHVYHDNSKLVNVWLYNTSTRVSWQLETCQCMTI